MYFFCYNNNIIWVLDLLGQLDIRKGGWRRGEADHTSLVGLLPTGH